MFGQQVYLAILASYLSIAASVPTDLITKTLDGRDAEKKFLSIPFSVKNSNINATSTGLGALTKRGGNVGTPIAQGHQYYSIELLTGSNQQPVELIVDTGSSDTWVVDKNAQCASGVTCKLMGTYDPTQSSTSQELAETFFLVYLDYSTTSGNFYLDDVTIPNGPTLNQFQFGDGTVVSENYGILGVGLEATEQQVLFGGQPPYPNFPFALKNQGVISKAAYSLYLNDAEATSGTLLFGGIDNAKIEGGLLELPGAFSKRLGVSVQSFTVDGSDHSLEIPFVFDSGYHFSALPPSIADAIGIALSGSQKHGGVFPYSADCAQPDKNITINFSSGNNQIAINVPYSSFVVQRGKYGSVCNATLNYSSDGSDPDNEPTIGQDIMRSFYLVYDTEGNNISVGQAKYTTESDISNIE